MYRFRDEEKKPQRQDKISLGSIKKELRRGDLKSIVGQVGDVLKGKPGTKVHLGVLTSDSYNVLRWSFTP